MELNQKVVAELRRLRYAVYLVALGLVVVAVSSIFPWLSVLWQSNEALVNPAQQLAQTSQCGSGGETFYNEARALFEKAKYKDLVGFSEKRLASCPSAFPIQVPPGPGSELPTDYLYTRQRDAGWGLYHFKARWFDSHLGRFSQADSLIPNAGFSIAWDAAAGAYRDYRLSWTGYYPNASGVYLVGLPGYTNLPLPRQCVQWQLLCRYPGPGLE